MLLLALMFLGSPSFILLAAAANQCFGADDGGYDWTDTGGILYQAVRDYMSQDCPNNNNCTVGQTYGWPMNSWCVGNVTDMSWLFYDMDTFNGDLSSWDTSNVESMWNMFDGATSFNNDLSAWNTSSVTSLNSMFYGATSFNGDISSWDISNVIDMRRMFYGATSFNQDLCAWGDKFPYDNAAFIFANSGCTYQDDPQDLCAWGDKFCHKEDQKGPFCACSAGYYYGSFFTVASSLLLILLGFYQ